MRKADLIELGLINRLRSRDYEFQNECVVSKTWQSLIYVRIVRIMTAVTQLTRVSLLDLFSVIKSSTRVCEQVVTEGRQWIVPSIEDEKQLQLHLTKNVINKRSAVNWIQKMRKKYAIQTMV